MTDPFKYMRLFVETPLAENATITLEKPQAHYLRNVLRKEEGAQLRLFNGRDGEYLATLTALTKTGAQVRLDRKLKDQPPVRRPLHLLFSPIKKHRMDFMIEKSVELGVTDLHPLLMHRTDMRKINEDRLHAQITEAAEQCERLDIPQLHAIQDMPVKIARWKDDPIFWCQERRAAPHLALQQSPQAFLIGPEGGFDETEMEFLSKSPHVKPVSLGETVYRAETAALICLAHMVKPA